MRVLALAAVLAAGVAVGGVAAPAADARTVAGVRANVASVVGGPCLATCIGKRLEERDPGSAAAVWCSYGGGAQWGCLTMLVEESGRPTCRQLVVTPSGRVVESVPSDCPIRLEQPLTVHTK